MKQDVTVELAGGKQIKFETGRMAKQAPGAALTTSGDNVVLATAVASPDPKEGIDFFPLTVEYREFTYAGGRIPGGFIKREGRPSEKEILTSRQIDRPIRRKASIFSRSPWNTVSLPMQVAASLAGLSSAKDGRARRRF